MFFISGAVEKDTEKNHPLARVAFPKSGGGFPTLIVGFPTFVSVLLDHFILLIYPFVVSDTPCIFGP